MDINAHTASVAGRHRGGIKAFVYRLRVMRIPELGRVEDCESAENNPDANSTLSLKQPMQHSSADTALKFWVNTGVNRLATVLSVPRIMLCAR